MFLGYYGNPCAIWLGMVTALCPVAIYQLMTLEVDGQLGSELTTLVCCLVILTRAPNKKLFLALALVIVALINIKMTSAIFVAVLGQRFCFCFILSSLATLAHAP